MSTVDRFRKVVAALLLCLGVVSVRAEDWPDVARYRAQNATVGTPKPGTMRVVFIGDSITDRWGRQHGKFFPGEPGYINRGIGGQVSGQMLARFQQDVIQLEPKAVVILAGTNDIPSNIPPQDTEANLTSMVELARFHKIKVVLASLLPVSDYYRPNQTTRRPLAKLREINDWIESYCRKNKLVFLDYFKAMSDDHDMLKCELTVDGVHPSDAGYDVMASVASQAIQKALGKK
jgi:lysophospholipase L1-like esterase